MQLTQKWLLSSLKNEGRDAFLKLMETTDIFIEASKGPAFARRGITDRYLVSGLSENAPTE